MAVVATREIARAAAELQEELQRRGTALSARDAYVAGTARALDERLAAADGDFEAVAGPPEVDLP